MRRIPVAIISALLLAIVAVSPAAAQGVRDWDDVTNPAYDTANTDAANRQLSESDAEYRALGNEIETIEREVGPISGADQISPLEDRRDAAEDEFRSGTEDLVDARAEAIDEGPVEGSPDERETRLDDKLDALDAVEAYADEWGVEAGVSGVRAEVEAELEAVEQEQEAAEAPETTAAPEETTEAAPPAEGGQGGGNDQSSPPPQPQGSEPAGGLTDTLRTGGIGAGLALAVAGIVALVARTKRPKPTQRHTAPEQPDYDPDEPTVGGRDE